MYTLSRPVASLATAAMFLATEGVAHATPQCPPGTHPSQWGFRIAGALSVFGTLACFGLGLKVALGHEGGRRVAGVVLTLVATAVFAFCGFWFTLIAGLISSGCVSE